MTRNIAVLILMAGFLASATMTNTAMADQPRKASNHVRLGLGERADWMRGSWGLNWKPASYGNGFVEKLTIDEFLDQISELKTVDYVQLHLTESSSFSPLHTAPHDILESLWQGDVDAKGRPVNLIVPRASKRVDPFLDWLEKTRAAGLKIQAYVNSFNLLARNGKNPGEIKNVSERWKKYCDTTPTVQAFIKSRPYHRSAKHPERQYMFCYAEFVLKEYAVRYGDLIDAWIFDTAPAMNVNGDNPKAGVVEQQRIYEAFANAVHAGNPNAAVSFNNGTGAFARVTRFDDYTFGHPYGGGEYIGNHANKMYDRNHGMITKIVKTNGYVHAGPKPFNWDEKVVGHFDPPMSSTRWNSGSKPGLTDQEFLLWNEEALIHGGAISWGLPLIKPVANGRKPPKLTANQWAFKQLQLLDDHLSKVQFPDMPNWRRANTVLPNASIGKAYSHTLTDGFDFWDSSGEPITRLQAAETPFPLEIMKSSIDSKVWVLRGTPTDLEPGDYSFRLRIQNRKRKTSIRSVTMTVE